MFATICNLSTSIEGGRTATMQKNLFSTQYKMSTPQKAKLFMKEFAINFPSAPNNYKSLVSLISSAPFNCHL